MDELIAAAGAAIGDIRGRLKAEGKSLSGRALVEWMKAETTVIKTAVVSKAAAGAPTAGQAGVTSYEQLIELLERGGE